MLASTYSLARPSRPSSRLYTWWRTMVVSGDSGSSRVGKWRERVERNIWRNELLGMRETRRYAAARGRREDAVTIISCITSCFFLRLMKAHMSLAKML